MDQALKAVRQLARRMGSIRILKTMIVISIDDDQASFQRTSGEIQHALELLQEQEALMAAAEEKIIPLSPNEEKVHHAIIYLYEIDEEAEVTRAHICNRTWMQIGEVSVAMDALVEKGLITMGEHGVVLAADNNGYYPEEDDE